MLIITVLFAVMISSCNEEKPLNDNSLYRYQVETTLGSQVDVYALVAPNTILAYLDQPTPYDLEVQYVDWRLYFNCDIKVEDTMILKVYKNDVLIDERQVQGPGHIVFMEERSKY